MSGIGARVIGLCILLGITDGFNSLAMGYVIPSLSELWDVTPGSFSLVITAAVVGEILASALLAPLSDRFGRKRMIALGVGLFSVATLVAYFAPGLEVLIAIRFVAGLGIGTATPNLLALGPELAPTKAKSSAVMFIGTGMAAGGAICGLVAAYVVPNYGGLALFIVCGLVPLVALVVSLPFLSEATETYLRRGDVARVARLLNQITGTQRYTETDEFVAGAGDEQVKPTLPELFREGRAFGTILVWIMMFMGIAGSYLVFSWLVTILVMSGVDEATAIIGSSVTTLGGIVGGILFGFLMDRTSLKLNTLFIGVAVQIVAALALANLIGGGSSSALVVGVCMLLGLGIIGTAIATNAVAVQTYTQSLRGTGIGWANAFSRLGGIVAPIVGGQLIDSGLPANAMLYLSIVLYVVLGVALALFLKFGRQGAREEVEDAPDVELPDADLLARSR